MTHYLPIRSVGGMYDPEPIYIKCNCDSKHSATKRIILSLELVVNTLKMRISKMESLHRSDINRIESSHKSEIENLRNLFESLKTEDSPESSKSEDVLDEDVLEENLEKYDTDTEFIQ